MRGLTIRLPTLTLSFCPLCTARAGTCDRPQPPPLPPTWLAFYLFLFLFFYKAFLFICVCKIYARGYKIICCQDKAGQQLGSPTPFGPLQRCGADAANAADAAAVRILWANANYLAQLKIADSTHIHTHTNAQQSNCNHSVCCLSLLFYFCLHFSVSGTGAGWRPSRTRFAQSARDTLPSLPLSLSPTLSRSLAESELCSQQFIENIFVVSKTKQKRRSCSKTMQHIYFNAQCELFLASMYSYSYSYSYRYRTATCALRPPLGLAFTVVSGCWPSNAEDQQSTRFQ